MIDRQILCRLLSRTTSPYPRVVKVTAEKRSPFRILQPNRMPVSGAPDQHLHDRDEVHNQHHSPNTEHAVQVQSRSHAGHLESDGPQCQVHASRANGGCKRISIAPMAMFDSISPHLRHLISALAHIHSFCA